MLYRGVRKCYLSATVAPLAKTSGLQMSQIHETNKGFASLAESAPFRCPDLPKVYVGSEWYERCGPKRLNAKFPRWTSNDCEIDGIIGKTQANAGRYDQYSEWIEPDRFVDIKHLADGGYGSIYKATWLDG